MKEEWGSSWTNVRYPDGRIFNNQRLQKGANAPGELIRLYLRVGNFNLLSLSL